VIEAVLLVEVVTIVVVVVAVVDAICQSVGIDVIVGQ